MVDNQYPCSVEQGFNYNKNNQVPFGFLDALTIGTEELAADIQVKTPDGDLNAVAVIEHTERAIQPTDATKYTLRLSVANQQKLAAYANKMDDTDVEHSHVVYAYDPNQKQYYKAYHTDSQSLKSVIDKDEAGKLNISLEKETAHDVQQPLNYRLIVALRPKPEEQTYITAVSETQKNCHQYGVTNA